MTAIPCRVWSAARTQRTPDNEDTEDTEDSDFNNEIRWFVNIWKGKGKGKGKGKDQDQGRGVTARARPWVVASEREPL